MRKAYLILFTIPIILILSGLIANNLDTGKENKQEPYRPPICGNNICEEDEEDYCLDCNLSCESEFCNSKINIICNGCTETQKKLLPTLFEHQNIVYDCLSDYYGYNPSRLISHTVTKGAQDDPCAKKEICSHSPPSSF